jgi:hypothetical protein
MQTTDISRKRSRSDGVPDIPGVSSDVGPFLTAAITETTKAYQNLQTVLSFGTEVGLDLRATSSRTTNNNALEHILDRFRMATAARDDKQARRLERMKEAIAAWENTLKRDSKTATKKVEDEVPLQKSYQSMPMASFVYVWNLQQHNHVPVRRATLYLASNLLETNNECRMYWKEHYVLKWVKWVTKGSCLEQHSSQVPLWQTEAQLLLSRMVKSFTDPQLRVALRFLQQRCPQGTRENGSANETSMVDWRHVRDFALQHGDKEIEICEKLVRRAHLSTDVLVPRMGSEVSGNMLQQDISPTNHTEVDDDDDDEDIDWQEGDTAVSEEAHLAAVEQTLAVMQSTGELRGGDLEIDLEQESSNAASQANEVVEQHKRKLAKIVLSLSTLHMPRLSSWVNALTNADNLVQPPGQSSLVAITTGATRTRGELLRRLLVLKTSVTVVLSSSTKLETGRLSRPLKPIESSRLPPPASLVGLSNVPQRHDRLTRSIANRRQSNKPMGSKRIQIKYRSS